MTVAAICYEGEQAEACLAQYKPDLVFLTIEMPRMNGLAIAEGIQKKKGSTRISSSSPVSAISCPIRYG